MIIDKVKALRILEQATEASSSPIEGPWVRRVKELEDACGGRNLTMIAMLGTALLAKATHIEVDPLALKVGDGQKGVYSARALCKEVLAANAPRLGIDLGVTGREPLNNQPFFGKLRVSRSLPIKTNARESLNSLVTTLETLAKVDAEEEALSALRAFVSVRRRKEVFYKSDEDTIRQLTIESFVTLIEGFVRGGSEGGKRAQAVTAGLMDVIAGHEQVAVGRINDPDRRFPGDVGISEVAQTDAIERSFEVRDKPVSEADLYHFVNRVASRNVSKAGVIAVAKDQQVFDLEKVQRWSSERGVMLVVYFGWSQLVKEVLFWSHLEASACIPIAHKRIMLRMVEMEVSESGMEYWDACGW